MSLGNLIKSKQKQIIDIGRKYGASNIRLFGSVARGESNAHSDIDFLVTMKRGSSLLDIIAIKQEIEDLLGAQVDVVTEASISPYIREEVLREAVNL